MLKISRLRKIAQVENLGEKNISTSVLNVILQKNEADATVSNIIFRKLLNSTTKYIIEIWQLNSGKFVVFSGYYKGDWTPEDVQFHGIFEDEPDAELYAQENLQNDADSKENLLSPSIEPTQEEKTENTASLKKDLRRIKK